MAASRKGDRLVRPPFNISPTFSFQQFREAVASSKCCSHTYVVPQLNETENRDSIVFQQDRARPIFIETVESLEEVVQEGAPQYLLTYIFISVFGDR